MEYYQPIDCEDHPKNAAQRAIMVSHSVEMIERMIVAINRHKTYRNPDQLAIDQFTELKEQYIAELADLLQPIGVVVQLSDRQHKKTA